MEESSQLNSLTPTEDCDNFHTYLADNSHDEEVT